jgi:hypothetical protein
MHYSRSPTMADTFLRMREEDDPRFFQSLEKIDESYCHAPDAASCKAGRKHSLRTLLRPGHSTPKGSVLRRGFSLAATPASSKMRRAGFAQATRGRANQALMAEMSWNPNPVIASTAPVSRNSVCSHIWSMDICASDPDVLRTIPHITAWLPNRIRIRRGRQGLSHRSRRRYGGARLD